MTGRQVCYGQPELRPHACRKVDLRKSGRLANNEHISKYFPAPLPKACHVKAQPATIVPLMHHYYNYTREPGPSRVLYKLHINSTRKLVKLI